MSSLWLIETDWSVQWPEKNQLEHPYLFPPFDEDEIAEVDIWDWTEMGSYSVSEGDIMADEEEGDTGRDFGGFGGGNAGGIFGLTISNLSWCTDFLLLTLSSLLPLSLIATPTDFIIMSSCIDDLLVLSLGLLFPPTLLLKSIFPMLLLLLLLMLLMLLLLLLLRLLTLVILSGLDDNALVLKVRTFAFLSIGVWWCCEEDLSRVKTWVTESRENCDIELTLEEVGGWAGLELRDFNAWLTP